MLLYLVTNPLWVILFVPPSKEMNTLNYFTRVMLRWQVLNYVFLAISAAINLIVLFPYGYLLYEFVRNNVKWRDDGNGLYFYFV